jgi:SOS-response transcriptional repressor LexA
MTERQQRIASFIDRYWEEHWTSPSVREVAREAKLRSSSSAHLLLTQMVRAGILECKRVGRTRVLYRVRERKT